MKKILFLIIVALFSAGNSLKCLEYSSYSLNFNQLLDMKMSNGKIYVLGSRYSASGGNHPSAVKFYDGQKWDSLPEIYYRGNEEITIKASLQSRINFDSSGNLWLTGQSLLCYKDNKWNEYYIDDADKDYRDYQEFCIDKFNNIWIITKVYKDSQYNYSEILKFDGNNFISVLKSNTTYAFSNRNNSCIGNIISALPDGRVCFLRGFFKGNGDSDFDSTYQDLYFYNQDMTFTKTKLQINYGSKYFDLYKTPANIIPENEDKIWFCTKMEIGSSNGQAYDLFCCSGLYLYEKGNWTLFNEVHGLDYLNSADTAKAYREVWNIQKITPEQYMVIAKGAMYLMGNDYLLKRINTLELGKKAKLIREGDYKKESGYETALNMLFSNDGISLNSPGNIYKFNNEFWLLTSCGILVFKEDAITSVEDERQTNENENALYPNPAKDILNIQDYLQYSNYEIYDLLGKKVSSGEFSKNYIDVNSLANGNYYIILHTNNKTYQIKYFVKE